MADVLPGGLLGQPERLLGEGSTAGFFESALSSMGPEMIGLDPMAGVEQWRAENPTAALVSQMLGFGIPYLGWTKAARVLKLESFISTLGAEAPQILAGAMRSGTRWAPFEASRIALSAAMGGNVLETGESAGINLAIETALGAAGGALRSFARTRPGRVMEAAGITTDDSYQVQAAKLQDRLAQVERGVLQMSDEEMGVTREALSNIRSAIRTQRPVRDANNVLRPYTEGNFEIGGAGWLGGGMAQVGNAREFRRLFNLQDTPILRQRNSRHIRDVISTAALEELGGIGLLDNMQFPREMLFRQGTVRPFLQRRLSRMQQVDADTWIAKEHNDGLWIMAKRIRKELPEGLNFNNPAARASNDWERFVIFKTDRPERFSPQNALWAANVRDKVFDVETLATRATNPGPLVESLDNFSKMVDYKVVGGRPRGAVKRMAEKLGVDKLVDSGPVQTLGQIANNTVVPAMFENLGSLRATRASAMIRQVMGTAQKLGNRLLYGEGDVQNIKSAWSLVAKSTVLTGGPVQAVRRASDQAMADLHLFMDEIETIRAANRGVALVAGTEGQIAQQMFTRGRITEEGRDLITQLAKLDEETSKIVTQTEAAFGIKNGLKPLFGHLSMPRTWEGDWRAQIIRENGDSVYVAGGFDAGAAERRARDYIKEAEAAGTRGLRLDRVYRSDTAADMHAAIRIRSDAPEYRQLAEINRRLNLATPRPRTYARRPGTTALTPGALTDRQLRKEELAKLLIEHTENKLKYSAELTVRRGMMNEFDRLKLEDPAALNRVLNRIDDYVGRPGPISKLINRGVDAVLAPVIGSNSATKIVHAANRFIYNWDLGMGNLMFPIVNAGTMVQTVTPHIAFMMKAHPDVVQRMYSMVPVSGADGLVRGAVGVLSPIRMLGQSMRQMSARAWERDPLLKALHLRAIDDSVLDPKFIEGHIGESASRVRGMREAFASPGKFVEGLEAVSSFLPSMSEKFARTHAFNVGIIVARDVWRLTDPDKIYQTAKEFVWNTMFLYSTADRARIITGPLGTFLGLFKNWQMHYIGAMMQYAGEGLLRGNWSPLLWQTAGTFSLAGVKGLPGFAVADAFAQWGSDQSMLGNIYDWFGEGEARDVGDAPLADAIYMGLPGMLGLSLTSSTGAPFADPVRDAGMLMSFVHLDRMRALATSVGEGIEAWSTTGQHPITNDATRRQFMRALAPRSIYRAMSVMEGNFIQSLNNGYPSISGLSLGERVMYGMGFNPRWVSLQFDVQRELWSNQQALRAAIANYGELITEARAERDWRMVTRLQQQATVQGLPLDSIWNSVSSREAKGQEDTIARQFSEVARQPHRQAGLL